MKKTLSLVLCMIMMLGTIASVNSFATDSEIIFATDFDTLDGFEFGVNGYNMIQEIVEAGDVLHGNVMHVQQEPAGTSFGAVTQKYTFENAVSSGVFHTSYQLKVTGEADRAQFIKVEDSQSTEYGNFALLSSDKNASYVEDNWGSKSPAPAFTLNEWTQIDIVADFINNKAYLYSNGKLINKTESLRMKDIKSITFMHYAHEPNSASTDALITEVFVDDMAFSTAGTDIYATDVIYDNDGIYFKLSATIAENVVFPTELALKKVGTDETVKAAAELVTNKTIKLTPEETLDKNAEYAVVFPEDAAYSDIFGNSLTAEAKGFFVRVPAAEVTVNVPENIPAFEDADAYSSSYLTKNNGWYLGNGWDTSALVNEHAEGNKGVKLSGSAAPAVLYELSNIPDVEQYTMKLSYDAKIEGDAITGAYLDPFLVQNDNQTTWSSNARSRLMTMNVADSADISYWTGSGPYISSATENTLYENIVANTWYTFEYTMLLGEDSGNKVSYTIKNSEGGVIASASGQSLMNASFVKPWRIAFTSNANTTVWLDNLKVDYSYSYTPASVESVRLIGLDNSEIVPEASVSNNFKGISVQFSKATEASATLVGAAAGNIELTPKTSEAAEAHTWELSEFLAPDTYTLEITYGENNNKYTRTFTTENAEDILISEYGIYDGNLKVEKWNDELIGKSLTAKASILNPTGTEKRACIIYAAYDGEKMIAVNFNNALGEEIEGSFDGQTVQVPFTVPENCDGIKVLLWTGLNTMKPLALEKAVKK